ncbi:MAG: DUF4864 domain-containing protein [Candidatus Aureabacteria bacterium]|nr:DUF4864 domain-containing protein [Candidatus Auribacterota bacterium]
MNNEMNPSIPASEPSNGAPIQTPSQPPAKKKSPLKWILIGGCGCIVIIILFVALLSGGIFMGIKSGREVADPLISKQAAAIENGDIDAAYALCSDDFKAGTDRAAYENFINAAKAVLTIPLNDYTFNSVNRTNNVLTMQGTAKMSDGNTIGVEYQFIKKGEEWYFLNIKIGN